MHERSSVVAGAPRICLVPEMTDLPSLVNIKGSPEISSVASGSTRWLVRGAIAVALVVAASWLGYAVGFSARTGPFARCRPARLAVEQPGSTPIFQIRLPAVLARDDAQRFPAARRAERSRTAANRQPVLEGVNLLAGAENLYVLERSGDTLAASDLDQPGTPFGQNLSFRPYVSEASRKVEGRSSASASPAARRLLSLLCAEGRRGDAGCCRRQGQHRMPSAHGATLPAIFF